jgi:hypothetical protein
LPTPKIGRRTGLSRAPCNRPGISTQGSRYNGSPARCFAAACPRPGEPYRAFTPSSRRTTPICCFGDPIVLRQEGSRTEPWAESPCSPARRYRRCAQGRSDGFADISRTTVGPGSSISHPWRAPLSTNRSLLTHCYRVTEDSRDRTGSSPTHLLGARRASTGVPHPISSPRSAWLPFCDGLTRLGVQRSGRLRARRRHPRRDGQWEGEWHLFAPFYFPLLPP